MRENGFLKENQYQKKGKGGVATHKRTDVMDKGTIFF